MVIVINYSVALIAKGLIEIAFDGQVVSKINVTHVLQLLLKYTKKSYAYAHAKKKFRKSKHIFKTVGKPKNRKKSVTVFGNYRKKLQVPPLFLLSLWTL